MTQPSMSQDKDILVTDDVADQLQHSLHNDKHNTAINTTEHIQPESTKSLWKQIHVAICIVLLFLNYFTAQYDKFILSYFQIQVSTQLNLSPSAYATLSGYATSIVYALLALPIAYLSDYLPNARVWTLSIASIWWSLSVIFQSLANNFWQILLARISMGIGQSAVESLSISLISDFVPWRDVFLGTSAFYVGVYIGEAVSGQIAVAFPDREDGWRVALRAIGIVGLVLGVLISVVIRDHGRQESVVRSAEKFEVATPAGHKLKFAKAVLRGTASYLLRTHSFWLIVLSASFRQLSGNVFGYYMPSYLASTFDQHPELLSRYGIIVGAVGSVTVLAGGLLTSVLWHRTKTTPLYLTGIGGMISSLFVLLMIFSRDIANGNQNKGIKILYGTMSLAYLTAESWLGAVNGLIALLLPPRYKTFGLAIWATIQVLIYSSGPQIIGLALRNTDASSPTYTKDTQVALAVIIPIGYWIAGVGFLLAVPLLKRDFKDDIAAISTSKSRRMSALSFAVVLAALVLALFIASIYYAAI